MITIGYFICAILTFLIIARCTYKDFGPYLSTDEEFVIVVMALIGGLLWPVVLVLATVYVIIFGLYKLATIGLKK